jgi:hypothetical protein
VAHMRWARRPEQVMLATGPHAVPAT